MYQISQEPQKTGISRQEAVRVGNVVVLAQHNKKMLKEQQQRFLAQGYQISETCHFVVCRKQSSHHIVVMHMFNSAEIDADLICFIEDELPCFGITPSERAFGAVLFAVLASTFPAPRDQRTIWKHFCLNTLARLRQQIATPPTVASSISYITPFATIYRRAFELIVGESLLDVGSSFGFLPILWAERTPNALIVGCDNNPDAIGFSRDVASSSGIKRPSFLLQDVLNDSLMGLGRFETVTAIHLLEHLAERDLATAFTHLLNVTSQRLIIAVPYEKEAQTLYGHHHVFTAEKLQEWGQWCVEALDGKGSFRCEEVSGGMLIVDRFS